jgi:hypothetical protein
VIFYTTKIVSSLYFKQVLILLQKDDIVAITSEEKAICASRSQILSVAVVTGVTQLRQKGG